MRTDDIVDGTFCPWDGYAGPSEVLSGFASAARQEGAKIREGVEAVGIQVKGGKIESVATREGVISTNVVVNAAGPHAAQIGAMAGVDVRVKPLRKQIFVTAPFRLTEQVDFLQQPERGSYRATDSCTAVTISF